MDALVELKDAGADLGGKAHGLARLAALGLPVPPALVLPAAAYARWRERGELPEEALAEAFARLGPPLAVRSSALDEDTEGRSAAGQYESVLGVRTPEELRDAVETCYRAAESERARAYRGARDAELALLLQRDVPAARAAVAFSRDPLTGSDDVLIEAVYGHGEQLVSGQVDPDRYWVARDGAARVRARIADKPNVPAARRFARTLRDDEAAAVAAFVLEAERGFDCPVDVELCLDGPRTWLVQSRPITTLR